MKNKFSLLIILLCGAVKAVDLGGGSPPPKQKPMQPRILLDFSDDYKSKHNSFRGWFAATTVEYSCVGVSYDQYTATKVGDDTHREILAQGKHHSLASTLICVGYSYVFSDKIYCAGVIGLTQNICSSTQALEIKEYASLSNQRTTDVIHCRAVYGGTGVSAVVRTGLVLLPRLILYGLIGVQLEKHKIVKDKTKIINTVTTGSTGSNSTTTTINPTNNDPSWFYPGLRAGIGVEMRMHAVLSCIVEVAFVYANSHGSVNKFLSRNTQNIIETSIINKNVGFTFDLGIVYNI